jgi:hypothetical protein
MTDSPELTFRDFASAVMGNTEQKAAEILAQLIQIDAQQSVAATTFFKNKLTSDPAFMMKAMGLRQAVTEGSSEQIQALLHDLFDLPESLSATAAAHLKKKHAP